VITMDIFFIHLQFYTFTSGHRCCHSSRNWGETSVLMEEPKETNQT
jgi:hypothetical protein